jgi:hypothetical protein
MNRWKPLIRTVAGIVFIWSILALILVKMVTAQTDVLPEFLGRYWKIMTDDSMAPAFPSGTLVMLKETDPYMVGDVIGYLDDKNKASISRIREIDGRTEDVSVSVPYSSLSNEGGGPGFSAASVMDYDPDVKVRGDTEIETHIFPADRIMAKALFHSRILGYMLRPFENNLIAALYIAISGLIVFWPYDQKGRPRHYSDEELDGMTDSGEM